MATIFIAMSKAAPMSAAVMEDAQYPWLAPYSGQRRSDIDVTELRHKVLCGYQGWFRCPDDGTNSGWRHWSRDLNQITPRTLTFDMWPDLSEYGEDEKFPALGFKFPGARQAFLFSSANSHTVDRHFEWMRQYGIDGVFVQRFALGLADPPAASQVLAYCRNAANRTGRAFAVTYDLTGADPEQVFDLVTRDWRFLVDQMHITSDPRYLHDRGKPVLHIFGFFPDQLRTSPANRLLDFFLDDPKYGALIIGGVPWQWRKESDPGWANIYRRFDILSPWNVGNTMMRLGDVRASTAHWKEENREIQKMGKRFLPVVYPGFSWDNLKQKPPGSTEIPRYGGNFYWDQFARAIDAGAQMVYVAMFDEVDEGTAIFKVTNDPPRQGNYVTYDGYPADWYLRLTGEASKMLRGERKYVKVVPIKP